MFNLALQPQSDLKNKITQNYRRNEQECIQNLLEILDWDSASRVKKVLH